jgi:hypothetical protein
MGCHPSWNSFRHRDGCGERLRLYPCQYERALYRKSALSTWALHGELQTAPRLSDQ